ncbi:MAG: sel1 repeat family protein [Deltaproteobacteria bacterium]|nr:sel1 repeat family protein [Deltaproteobacteria bacterium]
MLPRKIGSPACSRELRAGILERLKEAGLNPDGADLAEAEDICLRLVWDEDWEQVKFILGPLEEDEKSRPSPAEPAEPADPADPAKPVRICPKPRSSGKIPTADMIRSELQIDDDDDCPEDCPGVWHLLGLAYLSGLFGSPDALKGSFWLKRAAQAGLAESQARLGLLFLEGGPGLAADGGQAFAWLELASRNGHPEASFWAGHLLSEGLGRPRDGAGALEYFQLAAGRGCPEAMVRLGDSWTRGLDGRQDPAEAFRWYLKASEAGVPEGMHQAAVCFLTGCGISRDLDRHFLWLKQAAEAGLPESQHLLAGSLLHLKEGERDFQEAAAWLAAASGKGLAASQYALGLCCLQGRGRPRDRLEGARQLREAYAGRPPEA